MGSVPLLTSLAPTRPEIQKAAVRSWKQCGFTPISLNEPAEAESLAPVYPDVSFVPVDPEDIDRTTPAPLVRIDAFLNHCRRMDVDSFAMANADVLLELDLPFLCATAERSDEPSMCISHRIDVSSPDERTGDIYPVGFDFFFFNRRAVDVIPASPFCIGLPMWDYWLPLALLRHGHNVRNIYPPAAFHTMHDIQWNWDQYVRMAEQLFNLMGVQQCHLQGQSRFDSESRRQACYIGADMALQWILACARTLSPPVPLENS